MSTITQISGLLGNLHALHAAAIAFLASGLVAARISRGGSAAKSFALRCAVVSTLIAPIAALAVTLVVPDRLQPQIPTASIIAMPVARIVHPNAAAIPTGLDETPVAPGAVSPAVDLAIRHGIVSPLPSFVFCDFAVAVLWIGGAIALVARQIVGFLLVARMRRRATAVNRPGFDRLVDALVASSRTDAPCRPACLCCDGIDGPFVAGMIRPTIFLPASHVAGDTDAELAAILTHEMAHIRNRDQVFQGIAQTLCTLIWFQPLAWMLAREMENTAEELCDHEVVTSGPGDRHLYAELLYRIARSRVFRLTESVAGLGMAPRRSVLARRVERILNGIDEKRMSMSPAARIAVGAVFAAATVCVLASCALRYTPASLAAGAVPMLQNVWQPSAADLAAFTYARQQGWSIGPVQTLPGVFGTNAPVIPGESAMSASDLAVVANLNKLRYPSTFGEGWSPAVADRQTVEKVLAAHPHFWYAEMLLSTWYDKDNQPAPALKWRNQALADAPAIVAGRVQMADGSPAAGVLIMFNMVPYASWTISDMGGEQLHYTVTSGPDGAFYMPAPRCVLGQISTGSSLDSSDKSEGAELLRKYSLQPDGFPVSRFAASTRVAVIEPFIFRQKIALTVNGAPAPSDSSAIGSFSRPIALHGRYAAFRWNSFPGATDYSLQLSETVNAAAGRPTTTHFIDLNDGVFSNEGGPETEYIADLSGGAPGLLSGRTYMVQASALHSISRPGFYSGASLTSSNAIYFTTPDAPKALPLDTATIQSLIGPKASVTRIAKDKDTATIVIQGENASNESWIDRDLFGYASETSKFDILYPRRPDGVGDYAKPIFQTTIVMKR
jgi:beta-lactamase regulating signal transducer with metallopeptidase domain